MDHLVVLYVEDLAESQMFYGALFQTEPSESSENFAAFQASESLSVGLWRRGHVQPAVEEPGKTQGEICLFVKDHPSLDAKYAHCAEIGAIVIQEPVEMDFGRTFTVLDPNGIRIRYATPV